MIRINTKINLIHYCCYMYMLIALSPLLDYYANWYIVAIPIIILAIHLIRKKSQLQKVMALFLLAICLSLIQSLGIYTASNIVDRLINDVINWSSGLIALYFSILENKNQKEFIKKFLQVTIIIFGITSITTIIGLNVYPNAARELASGTAIYDTTIYSRKNIGGYSFIYSSVLLIPVLVWVIKKYTSFFKYSSIVVLVINLYCIYQSQYTIAIILAVIILLLTLFAKNIKRFCTLFASVMLFILCGGTSFLGNIILKISNFISFDYVADRMLQLSLLLRGLSIKTETTTERIEHYLYTFNGFLQSPIIGNVFFSNNAQMVSGHTVILDTLSAIGVIGLIIVSMIYVRTYRLFLRNKKIGFNSFMCLFSFVLLSLVNPSNFTIVFFVIFVCVVAMEKLNDTI